MIQQVTEKHFQIVGSLIYIMTCTRPDLSWIVSKLSQHLAEPKQQHWTAAKHLLRYLKGTMDQELHYRKCEGPGPKAYSLRGIVTLIGQLTKVTEEAPLDIVSA